MKPDVTRSERVYKTKNLDYYQKEVLEDSKKMKDEVRFVMALQKTDIDIRVLNYLFRYLQKVYINTDSIPVEIFTKVWRSLIGRESAYTHPNLEQKLVNVIIEDGEETISIHKLSKLVEISEFIPIRVKKDKNYSKEIQVIMSSGSQLDMRQQNREIKNSIIITPEESSLDIIMEFIWMKIEEKFTRIADAFRFFDQENNSTVNKNEFRDGLERLKVKIPVKDIQRVFNYLDKNKIGYFTYQEFTGLAEEKRR
jgi:Ca2+-binding EF-hand superfamily protein